MLPLHRLVLLLGNKMTGDLLRNPMVGEMLFRKILLQGEKGEGATFPFLAEAEKVQDSSL